jgi:hydrogenase maturation protein HypF
VIHAQIRVSGQVQGVGFRPFVFRLAHELGLAGWVRNDSEGVEIAVEGARQKVMSLIERLQSEPPVMARVEKVTHDFAQPTGGLRGFSIRRKQNGKVQTGIAPDMAICPECLAELFDPADRRYRHPFINCIHCGPRYTLTARMPYDRANTSMAKFTQCPECQHEYDTPDTRRFHAQPNACPECGPSLQFTTSIGNLLRQAILSPQPLHEFAPVRSSPSKVSAVFIWFAMRAMPCSSKIA